MIEQNEREASNRCLDAGRGLSWSDLTPADDGMSGRTGSKS